MIVLVILVLLWMLLALNSVVEWRTKLEAWLVQVHAVIDRLTERLIILHDCRQENDDNVVSIAQTTLSSGITYG